MIDINHVDFWFGHDKVPNNWRRIFVLMVYNLDFLAIKITKGP